MNFASFCRDLNVSIPNMAARVLDRRPSVLVLHDIDGWALDHVFELWFSDVQPIRVVRDNWKACSTSRAFRGFDAVVFGYLDIYLRFGFDPARSIVVIHDPCELFPQIPDWRVQIAGSSVPSCISGADAGKMAREILKDFGTQVIFEGRVEPSKVTAWLQGVDVCVFPGLWESFSYVTLEAAEAGRAIIGTETGAVAEILDGGRAGLMVRPGDVRGLAKALRKLMADADLRVKLGAAARKRFEERFHPDRVMGEILEVYLEAIERARERRIR